MPKKQQNTPQAAAAAAAPAPQKKARGHRQKGAGAVITAREPIVRDGVEVQVRDACVTCLVVKTHFSPMLAYGCVPLWLVVDGLQSWQRIPTQLLQEYCQRDKRPRPEYHRRKPAAPGQSRYCVLVRDSKKADKDLTFTPAQSFDTDPAAKEHAALLALFHLQPTIPLERKLPEPYRCGFLQSQSC